MSLAQRIDHTLLKQEATPEDIDRLCQEAKDNGFHAVCVNSIYVARAVEALRGTEVAVCSVIGFPLGAILTESKINEAKLALADGATELDMVIEIGQLKAGQHNAVQADIQDLVDVAHARQAIVKVIIETSLLTDEEKRQACRLALTAGADYVKTSTGFFGHPTTEDVKLIKEEVGDKARIKASGGIRTKEAALAMIEAGADRLGTSKSVEIVKE